MHLTLQDFEIRTAPNGENAIRILENESFDILLLDIQMAKMNGLEVLRYLKIGHIDFPPIMFTGADDPCAYVATQKTSKRRKAEFTTGGGGKRH